MIDPISRSTPRINPAIEEQRKQSVSAIHYGLHKTPDSLQSSNSLSKSILSLPPPSKPQIDPPCCIELELINTFDKRDRMDQQRISSSTEEMEQSQQRREKLREQQYEQLQALAIEQSHKDTWTKFGHIASMVTSAGSLVLGISLISSGVGTAAGIASLATGGITLFHKIMQDIKGYRDISKHLSSEKEKQEEIAKFMESGVFLFSLGLGIFSMGTMHFSGGSSLIKAATNESTISSILSGTGTISTGVSDLAKGYTGQKVEKTKQSLEDLKRKETVITHREENISNKFTNIWENNRHAFEEMRAILSQQQQSYIKRG